MKKGKPSILVVGNPGNSPDVEYASGFRGVDATLFLDARGGKHLVVPELEFGRARASTRNITVWTPAQLGVPRRKRSEMLQWAVHLLRQTSTRTVRVAPSFPVQIARDLERRAIRVRVSRTALFPGRAVKSADECRKIRQTQQAAVIAMRTAVAARDRTGSASSEQDRFFNSVITAASLERRATQVALTRCRGLSRKIRPSRPTSRIIVGRSF